MAQLHNVLYVVCKKSSIIKTYTADTLSALSEDIHVEGMRRPSDIVACCHDRQLYVADEDYCIWRVSPDEHSYIKWLPSTDSTTDTFTVNTLSLTLRHLLVTSQASPDIRQYNTANSQLLRIVHLPRNTEDDRCKWNPYHAVETARGTFVVGHNARVDIPSYAVSELLRFCHTLVILINV